MKSLDILEKLTFSEDNRIHEEESKFKDWMENGGYDDWLNAVNNPYPLTIDDILAEREPRKRTDVKLRLLRWRYYECTYCRRQIWLPEEFVKKPNPKEDPNYLLLCKRCHKERKKFCEKRLLSSWKWKTPKEKRLERRDRGGIKEFNKILNELRQSEELSINLKKRLSEPSKQLLLDTNDEEVESLCKVDGKLCHFVITGIQNMLIDDFRDRFKRLHETDWIHSRTMEDAAFVILHCLLSEKLQESIKKMSETVEREMLLDGISNRLVEAFLEPAFIGALIDAIEEKYPERIKLLYERDLPYFFGREAQRIKEELLKKHPELQIEVMPYFTRRIDPALLNVRKGDLWKLFRMPYWKGEKPVELLKRAEIQIRIKAWLRFRDFLSNLSADQLKQCKKTGLNAACCYVETYLHEFQLWKALYPVSHYRLKRGYKSTMLTIPASQEEWAKAFRITRQTLRNRIRELYRHDPSIVKKIKFVKEILA